VVIVNLAGWLVRLLAIYLVSSVSQSVSQLNLWLKKYRSINSIIAPGPTAN